MGLPVICDQDLDAWDQRFSEDVLKIELSGPDYHHLSVVDVPGLFHSKKDQCAREDTLSQSPRSDNLSDEGGFGNHPRVDHEVYRRPEDNNPVSDLAFFKKDLY